MTETALRSVGSLLRRLHDAGAAIAVDARAEWPRSLADPAGGTMLCHNDVCPENVVFRDGRATALIDFDLAAPGRAFLCSISPPRQFSVPRAWTPRHDCGSSPTATASPRRSALNCRRHRTGHRILPGLRRRARGRLRPRLHSGAVRARRLAALGPHPAVAGGPPRVVHGCPVAMRGSEVEAQAERL